MIRCAHLSDVQIRNFKRHDEFRKSFENLYKSLREQKPDVIVLTGDVAHTKTQISPEFVQLCSEYFINLASIARTVIIPGNHDGNLNNLSRLDALTPIVEALNNPNIHYYKHSGVHAHEINDEEIVFCIFSCFDDEVMWPKGKFKANCPVVGLYHGFVQGAILQNGMAVHEDAHKVQDFLKIVDYLMLGDIHRMQILDGKYRSAYAGSLIQQNYGESVAKGYLLWNIKSKEEHDVDFIELPNVTPFYTIQLKDDLKIPDKDFQKQARIRVFSRQLTVTEKDSIREKLKESHDPVEVKFVDDVSAYRQRLNLKSVKTTVESLSDLGVQEKLLKEFLKKYKLNNEVLSQILDINKRYNSQVKKEDDIVRNVQYKIKKVWWDNICSFGEDNEFDFTKHKGILGVFGRNGVGKSTFAVDTPSYCIYNKISKGVTKNDLIINENKNFCLAGMEIEGDDKDYKIERNTTVYVKSGKRKGNPVIQGKTDLNFFIDDESRNGEERSVTDNEIRKFFGTYDDFVATSVAPQWQLLDFINKGGTERQKLIGRYFDIDIFDRKLKLAREEVRDIKAQIKVFGDRDFDAEIKESSELVRELGQNFSVLEAKQKSLEKEKGRLQKEIDKHQSQVKNVGPVSKKLESSLLSGKQTLEVEIINQKNKVENIKNNIKQGKDRVEKIKHLISSIDIELVRSRKEDYSALLGLKSGFDERKNLLSLNVAKVSKRVEALRKYECIKNDNCCMQEDLSKALKEQEETKTEITEKEKKLEEVLSALKNFNVEELDKKLKIYEKAERELLVDEPSLAYEKDKLESEKTILSQLSERLEIFKKEEKLLQEHKEQIEKNSQLEEKVTACRKKVDDANKQIKLMSEKMMKLSGELGTATASLNTTKETKEKKDNLQKEYEAYDYFIQAMGKDGISQIIIRNNLDVVNGQIRNILSNGVDFDVEILDEGREIFFRSPKSPARRIELCSGMEKTMAAIAIRAALVSVTTLPRFNIFVLDEVFSALDPEYMDSITRILDYLKQLFDTVMIITHIDSLKDVVDHVVEVERDDRGYARISD